jgi:hypothetical protein
MYSSTEDSNLSQIAGSISSSSISQRSSTVRQKHIEHLLRIRYFEVYQLFNDTYSLNKEKNEVKIV